VLSIVAKEKNLCFGRRPKATMYIEDVAEFARVLLTTTDIYMWLAPDRAASLLPAGLYHW